MEKREIIPSKIQYIPIAHLKVAGLPVLSIIRMKLFTLDHRLILKKVGLLHPNDQRHVEKNQQRLFAL